MLCPWEAKAWPCFQPKVKLLSPGAWAQCFSTNIVDPLWSSLQTIQNGLTMRNPHAWFHESCLAHSLPCMPSGPVALLMRTQLHLEPAHFGHFDACPVPAVKASHWQSELAFPQAHKRVTPSRHLRYQVSHILWRRTLGLALEAARCESYRKTRIATRALLSALGSDLSAF